MAWQTWLGCRPILGVLVRKSYIKEKPVTEWHIIRHARAGMYLRDPYGVKPNAGDPRSDWGTMKQAWRFRNEDTALHVIDVYGWQGIVTTVSALPQHHH